MDTLLQDVRYSIRRLAKSPLFAVFALTRVITSQLYDVRPTDPVTFVLMASLLIGVALVANLVPALRATRVDPAVVLREE